MPRVVGTAIQYQGRTDGAQFFLSFTPLRFAFRCPFFFFFFFLFLFGLGGSGARGRQVGHRRYVRGAVRPHVLPFCRSVADAVCAIRAHLALAVGIAPVTSTSSLLSSGLTIGRLLGNAPRRRIGSGGLSGATFGSLVYSGDASHPFRCRPLSPAG